MNYVKESFTYKITFIGGKELLIEGHKGIVSYSEQEIIARVKRGKLEIAGEKLFLKEINEDELLISGIVLGVRVIK
ncbi:MAG: YabP/YqfC family sporulation protein [Clostridia bacterium]|nr:YabP/YqfC family sporulation protein [Clostridia bacterium]MBO7178403.1 YabP/YqfC family sporulation protein [Clostridia bacterium]